MHDQRPLAVGLRPLPLLFGQNLGGDLDKVPDIPGHKLILAVAGVEMAVVFVVLQGIKRPPALVAVIVDIDAGQNHAAPRLQGNPSAHLQRVGLQNHIGRHAQSAEQLVLDDAGGMALGQADNTLPAYRNHGYAGELLKRAIADAKDQGRKGLVLTCKDRLVHYYAKFGFENEGVSESVHGNIVWNQMRLKF